MTTFDVNNNNEANVYLEAYKSFKGKVSPMNTEQCRKHMSNVLQKDIAPEDVLWCFYHSR